MRAPIAVILATLLFQPVLAAGAGNDGPVQPSIVGGTDVADGRYPFLVSLQYPATGSLYDNHFCGGSLISPSWVLTAGHCVYRKQPAQVRVHAGTTDLQAGGGTDHSVAAIHLHPAYRQGRKPENDVALLRLSTPVPDARTVGLPGMDGAAYEVPGTPLSVAGWGALQWAASGPSRMQEVSVPYIATRECQRLYAGRFDLLPAVEMCASTAGKDACQGDSGGPLFVEEAAAQWQQLGVVSWGAGCARGDSPGVYARLADAGIIDFIRTTWTQD